MSYGYIRERSKPINVVTKLLAKNYEYLTPEIFKHLRIHYTPYEDRLCDSDLALSIVSTGLRPVFREATPEIFINLAIECLNPSPEKRPTAETIVSTVKKWKADLDSKEDSSIKKSFLDSDKLLRTHDNQIIENKTPNSRSFYNKSLEFKNLPDHSSCKPPRTRIIRSDSRQVDLVIPENSHIHISHS
ncbi:7829_t:CDS:2 [Entrophospora sp. SA101]|nr:7829_t:CDS:2 [Entrophospora sp. SA101]